jgi:hypothetical protein
MLREPAWLIAGIEYAVLQIEQIPSHLNRQNAKVSIRRRAEIYTGLLKGVHQ